MESLFGPDESGATRPLPALGFYEWRQVREDWIVAYARLRARQATHAMRRRALLTRAIRLCMLGLALVIWGEGFIVLWSAALNAIFTFTLPAEWIPFAFAAWYLIGALGLGALLIYACAPMEA